MKKNLHPIDRAVRIVLGVIFISLVFTGPANKWFLLGVIPLITGLIGWCPIDALLGIDTLRMGQNYHNKKIKQQ